MSDMCSDGSIWRPGQPRAQRRRGRRNQKGSLTVKARNTSSLLTRDSTIAFTLPRALDVYHLRALPDGIIALMPRGIQELRRKHVILMSETLPGTSYCIQDNGLVITFIRHQFRKLSDQ